MTLPRHTTPLTRSRAFSRDSLDPSSAWVQDEYAVILPIASEPYDWTLDDDAAPSLQVIPISPPISDSSARSRQTERKADLPEASVLIPVERIRPARSVRKKGAEPGRKHLFSSLLLLLLSVIAL